MKLFILFCVLNVVNVIIQTVKSIATIKCGRVMASLVNAIAYGLYTVVLVYTMCDLELWVKALVVALANLIGVYVVKTMEEKMRKAKLWKVEMTVWSDKAESLRQVLTNADIPFNMVNTELDRYTIVNVYCATEKQSLAIREIAKQFKAKYFVSETKNL